MRTHWNTALAALAALTCLGCGGGSFKLTDSPQNFAVVSGDGESHLRAKARDNVGLNIATFANVEGGTLEYWTSELVEKLGRRGYQLLAVKAAQSSATMAVATLVKLATGRRLFSDFLPTTRPECASTTRKLSAPDTPPIANTKTSPNTPKILRKSIFYTNRPRTDYASERRPATTISPIFRDLRPFALPDPSPHTNLRPRGRRT